MLDAMKFKYGYTHFVNEKESRCFVLFPEVFLIYETLITNYILIRQYELSPKEIESDHVIVDKRMINKKTKKNCENISQAEQYTFKYMYSIQRFILWYSSWVCLFGWCLMGCFLTLLPSQTLESRSLSVFYGKSAWVKLFLLSRSIILIKINQSNRRVRNKQYTWTVKANLCSFCS